MREVGYTYEPSSIAAGKILSAFLSYLVLGCLLFGYFQYSFQSLT